MEGLPHLVFSQTNYLILKFLYLKFTSVYFPHNCPTELIKWEFHCFVKGSYGKQRDKTYHII